MKRGRPSKEDQLTVVPPTKKQVQDIVFQIRQGRFLETAALMSGVKPRVLNKWITLGRKNTPGYVEFTDAIDRADSELGDKLMTGVMSCIEEGDAGALRWLYDKRFGMKEKHLQTKWLEESDEAEAVLDESTTVVALEDAEKQLEELLQASDGDIH